MNVRTILAFVIIFNVITVSFFLFFVNDDDPSSETTPDSGLNQNDRKWSKPGSKLRPDSKTAQPVADIKDDETFRIQKYNLNPQNAPNVSTGASNQKNNGSNNTNQPSSPNTGKVSNNSNQASKDNKGLTTDKVPTADQGPKANQTPKAADPQPKAADSLPKVANPLPKAADPLPKAADPLPKAANQAQKVADPVPKAANQGPSADQVKRSQQGPKDNDNSDNDNDDDSFGIDQNAFIELGKNVADLSTQLQLHRNYSSIVNPFRLLGFYQEVPSKYFGPSGVTHYEQPDSGLKVNPGYCDFSDLYNYFNPSNIYGKKYIFSDLSRNSSLVRAEVIDKIGVDVMPQVGLKMEGYSEERYDLDIRTTMFFTKVVDFHYYQEIGKQFLCAAQMYNHVPGHAVITQKESLVGTVNAYSDFYSQHPQCFNKSTFFPASYRLRNATECKLFFDEINNQSYVTKKNQTPLIYLMKYGKGAHRASGVFLFDEDQEKSIRNEYENGKLCGKNDRSILIQSYIQNPLLLDKQNKFDFRMYMLIASVDPLIVYYHDGFLRVSFQTYDPNSKDRDVHLTNTHLSKQIIAETTNETLKAELAEYQMWTLPKLQDFLLRSGKITDKDWLDNYLRPQFQRAYIHLARMSKHAFWKHSSVYEMSGLDFMLDTDLRLWLIEANGSPQLVGTSPAKIELMRNMLTGLFEIEYAYLKSKTKRLFAIVDKYYSDLRANKPYDLELAKKEFAEAMKNKLENEFRISNDNTWVKILDETIPGKGAYMGNIPDECII